MSSRASDQRHPLTVLLLPFRALAWLTLWPVMARRRDEQRAAGLETDAQYLEVAAWGRWFSVAAALLLLAALVLSGLIAVRTAQAYTTFSDYARPRPADLVQFMRHNPRHVYTVQDLERSTPADWGRLFVGAVGTVSNQYALDTLTCWMASATHLHCPDRAYLEAATVQAWRDWGTATSTATASEREWVQWCLGAGALSLFMALYVARDLHGWHDWEARTKRDQGHPEPPRRST